MKTYALTTNCYHPGKNTAYGEDSATSVYFSCVSELVSYFGIQVYFLIFDYLFTVCAYTDLKHVQLLWKLNGGGEVSCFALLAF